MKTYKDLCKPLMSEALKSAGLDKYFHRGKGKYIYYKNDNNQEVEVLDLLGGYGAALFGHNHPSMIDVIQDSFKQNKVFHDQFSVRNNLVELSSLLNEVIKKETSTSSDFIFCYTSTGAESVEVAISHAEMARNEKLDSLSNSINKSFELISDNIIDVSATGFDIDKIIPSWNQATTTEKIEFIKQFNNDNLHRPPIFLALKNAFHGKLNVSIQLTHGELYRYAYRRMGIDVRFFSSDDFSEESLNKLLNDEQAFLLQPVVDGSKLSFKKVALPLIGAIILEPVQGEGGVHCLSAEDSKILHKARNILQCLIISDEIQSGCGRCGTFLAGSQIGLKPDCVVLSKALGGSVCKIGVVAINKNQFTRGFDLIQSSTFGGDAISANVALKVVKDLTENNNFLNRITEIGQKLFKALTELQQKYPEIISDVRGKGLLQGIVFNQDKTGHSHFINTIKYQGGIGYLVTGCLLVKNRIRIAPSSSSSHVIRIEPTIQFDEADISRLIEALDTICLAMRYEDAGYLVSHMLPNQSHRTPKDFRDAYQKIEKQSGNSEPDMKVAFINHLITAEGLRDADYSICDYSEEQLVYLLDKMAFNPFVAPFPPVRVQSKTGKTVDFIIYPINITSQKIASLMEDNDLYELRYAVDKRLEDAKKDGCQIAGLGMFTSIIANNGKAVKVPGIKVTTGNSLTVAMAFEAIKRAEEKRQISSITAAVVGAAGNIGSVYASLISGRCERLLLVGSGKTGSRKRLLKAAYIVCRDVLEDIKINGDAVTGIGKVLLPYVKQNAWLDDCFMQQDNPGKIIYEWIDNNIADKQLIQISDDIDSIADVDLLICAANSSESFIDHKILKKSCVICDIAVPHNISDEALEERKDLICLRGGIVETPHMESLDARARAYLKEGQVYACMAETMVLGLDNYQQHYSYGNISRKQVTDIYQRATDNGFKLSELKELESM